MRFIAPAQDLISKRAEVHTQGGDYSNALQAASVGGYPEIIKLLSVKGANANTQTGPYGNVLNTASERGYQEIDKLLLDKGTNVPA